LPNTTEASHLEIPVSKGTTGRVPGRDPVAILQQTAFPLRKTSFLLSAEYVGDGWLQLLNLIVRCGTVKDPRNGDRLTEVLNAVVTVKLSSEEGKLPPFFDFGADEFEAYYRHFISSSRPEDVNYTYGARLQNWSWFSQEADRTEQANQLERTIDRLQRSQDSTMVLLGPTDLDRLDDAPCVVLITFNIVDEQLCGSYVIRSDDIYNAWPLNALSLTRLQREVSKRIGIPVNSATFISQSAHIYERDWDKAWAKLDKWFERRRPLPYQADSSGMFIFSPEPENDRARALLLSPEADSVLWEGASPDPDHLANYIVDTMPWLLARHILYVGKEAAKLTRALREGAPYEQG
jgi:thymidylate synthase